MIHQPNITAAPAKPTATRMAFDGFHHNDPGAPAIWRCWSCDGFMNGQRGYCASCACEVTCWSDQPAMRL